MRMRMPMARVVVAVVGMMHASPAAAATPQNQRHDARGFNQPLFGLHWPARTRSDGNRIKTRVCASIDWLA